MCDASLGPPRHKKSAQIRGKGARSHRTIRACLSQNVRFCLCRPLFLGKRTGSWPEQEKLCCRPRGRIRIQKFCVCLASITSFGMVCVHICRVRRAGCKLDLFLFAQDLEHHAPFFCLRGFMALKNSAIPPRSSVAKAPKCASTAFLNDSAPRLGAFSPQVCSKSGFASISSSVMASQATTRPHGEQPLLRGHGTKRVAPVLVEAGQTVSCALVRHDVPRYEQLTDHTNLGRR